MSDTTRTEEIITAADNLAHVAAFISGRLDVQGLSSKGALDLISECRDALLEAASGYWKTKGTDEDGIPLARTMGVLDEVFPEYTDYSPMCPRCRSGLPTWCDDFAPLFTIRCKKCLAHTKPALTANIARHRWIFDSLIECGVYREGISHD